MSACDPSNPATTPSNLQAAVSHHNHSEQKKRERGVVVGGRHSSVAEHWQLKPEALGLTPVVPTFFLSLAISKVFRQ